LSGRLLQQFFARLSAQLHNMYGPTETTIDVTHWTCQRQTQDQTVPIGYPVANTQTYILDKHLEPVPVGIPGELYIGGVQVARGYLNRPDLTESRFLSDPFSQDPKARLYKTGDLARCRPDGSIEFLGRLDRQVKVRGCRIEPAEVEAALKECAGVRNCVVAVLGSTPDEQYLAAYLVCSESVSSLSLRRYLRTRLPEYMIPSRFFPIERIPLLPNQKVDFEALRRIAFEAPAHTQEHQAPETPAERRLAAIWKDLLQVQTVGANDNFFDLGGHSLMAIRLMARMESEFGRRIEFRNLMYGTLGQLAATCA
jgi:acyl-CoA synthetase (AMP-forming)/AMP-acid ligase II/acyl carrier protein